VNVAAGNLFCLKNAIITRRHAASSPAVAIAAGKFDRPLQGPERARNFVENASNHRCWGEHVFSPYIRFSGSLIAQRGPDCIDQDQMRVVKKD
jgi:hypothetical protein